MYLCGMLGVHVGLVMQYVPLGRHSSLVRVLWLWNVVHCRFSVRQVCLTWTELEYSFAACDIGSIDCWVPACRVCWEALLHVLLCLTVVVHLVRCCS